ncbi:MAG: triose-phosphate isomerase [Lentisphaeria bacterium]
MARKTIIAGNWKMNKTAAEATQVITDLKAAVAGITDVEIVICPTFTCLNAAVAAAAGSNVKIGAQNIAWADNGAFTGEISGAMLKEAGVEWVIIGHSERRQYFAETDATVNARIKAALKNGLKVMFCIGETLEEREDVITNAVCEIQIRRGLKGITAEELANIVIAYEPVWAIGTGKTATPEMADETHAACRSVIEAMYGMAAAEAMQIQYGGSMNKGNSAALCAQANIDGGLVGGASLVAADFAELIKNAR